MSGIRDRTVTKGTQFLPARSLQASRETAEYAGEPRMRQTCRKSRTYHRRTITDALTGMSNLMGVRWRPFRRDPASAGLLSLLQVRSELAEVAHTLLTFIWYAYFGFACTQHAKYEKHMCTQIFYLSQPSKQIQIQKNTKQQI